MTASDFWDWLLKTKEGRQIHDTVHRVARRLLGESADKEDAASEVLLKLCEMRDRLGTIHDLRAYVAVMTANRCRQSVFARIRDRVRMATALLGGPRHAALERDERQRLVLTQDGDGQRVETVQLFRAGLKSLSKVEYQVFALKHLYSGGEPGDLDLPPEVSGALEPERTRELTHQEISKVLNVPVITVRRRLVSAEQKMRIALELPPWKDDSEEGE